MSQVITNAFENYWQSCLTAEQPVVLDEFILADIPNLDITSPIDPETGLPPESQIVHRQNVDQRGRINNNAVAYTIVMDTTVGDFSFNAMYLRNKQNGVIGMIVYKGRETKLKTDQTTGQTGNSLVKSMLMGYDQAADATLTHVDAGTWQIDYAARLRGMDEDIRQLQADLYGHHTFVGDGFKVVEKDGAYQVTKGVAIVGGLRVELKQPEVIHPGTKPIGVWVDAYRAGSLLSEHQNHFTIITSVADLTDHVDSNGYQHYVAKLGTVQADGTIEDGRGNTSSGETSITDALARLEQADNMLGIANLEALRRSYEEAGYNVVGTFKDGFSIVNWNDVGIDLSTGRGYSGPVGKVEAGTNPEHGGFTDISGSLLRGVILKQVFCIKDTKYNAPMNGIDDDSVAFNAASYDASVAPHGGVVKVPSGVLTIGAQCKFYDNVDYVFPRCSIEINVLDSVPKQAFYGENISNFSIVGGRFIGSGNEFTDGNQRHMVLLNCHHFSLIGFFGTKSRNDALLLDGCHDFHVDGIVTPSNYGIGFVCRDNCYNGTIGYVESNGNGNTGTATNDNGRGVLLWKSNSLIIGKIIAKFNREYNFRCYSQTGDSDGNRKIIIESLITESGESELTGKIDVYLYDESLLTNGIIINNLVCDTAPNRIPLVIQGDRILVNNYHATGPRVPTSAAISFYGAKNCKVKDIDARGFSALVSYSPTGLSYNCEVSDFYAEVSTLVGNMFGADNKISKGTAKHIGAGIYDVGITFDSEMGINPVADDILLDGFWRPLSANIDYAKMKLTGLRDRNSVDVVRVFGKNLQNLEWHGNDWAAAVNPAILKGAEVRRVAGVSRFYGFANIGAAMPLTHIAGDKLDYSNPVAAGKFGQVCISSGTPGIWKPYGAIDT